MQSLPRELELPEDGVLRIKPLRELETLRYDAKSSDELAVKDGATVRFGIAADAMEMEVTFESPAAKEFGIDVLCDADGENGMRMAVMPESKTLRVGNAHAPFELKDGEDLTLRIFIDKNLVEVFANDRQAAVAATPGMRPRSWRPPFQQRRGQLREAVQELEDEIDLSPGPPSKRRIGTGYEIPAGTITYEPVERRRQGKTHCARLW